MQAQQNETRPSALASPLVQQTTGLPIPSNAPIVQVVMQQPTSQQRGMTPMPQGAEGQAAPTTRKLAQVMGNMKNNAIAGVNQMNNPTGKIGSFKDRLLGRNSASPNVMTNNINMNQGSSMASTQMMMPGMMGTMAIPGGMGEAFMVLYRMFTVVVALIFMLIVVFTTTDIFKYMMNEATQRWKRFYDPNMYNKDTTDIDALRYISANAAEDETYNIFKTQRFVSYIFMVVGIVVIILGLQFGLFFGMKLWAIFNGRVFNEHVELPMKLLAVMVIIVVAGFAIKDVYTQRFTKRVQTSLVEVRSQLSTIRSFIYSNLSNNSTFLTALIADDIDMMSKVISDTLKAKTGNCTNSTSPCDTDVEKMIFSLNLYSFLRYQIPSSDPNFENVTKLFTPDGVANRTIDPTMYFYYNQPVYISNLYPSIREKLGSTPFQSATGNADVKQTNAASRERIMMLNINNKMQDLNTKLTRLHNLASGKVKVGTYLVVVALVVLVFCAVLLALFLPELMPYWPAVKGTILGIWHSIWRPKADNKPTAAADADD
jgi:hypothetical protein